jgi:hypothetical protein
MAFIAQDPFRRKTMINDNSYKSIASVTSDVHYHFKMEKGHKISNFYKIQV